MVLMAKAKKSSKGPSGTFTWNPTSFDAVVTWIGRAKANPQICKAMLLAIQALGSLTCPSPASDPNGLYRVGVSSQGVPEIQRQEHGSWIPV
jgi:hypothetical protein